ncbi:MAG: DUF3488 domain-containing protein [Acidobacteria bacterium]|nr:MAG: DUF3488 domain-containing protein [Acidobacteriota bacterium]
MTSLSSVISIPLMLVFFSLYSIGIYMDFKNHHPIRRLFLNLLALSLTLYFLSQLSLDEPLKPFGYVVALLLGVKSLEEKRVRDIYQMLLLSLFAVSLSTVYNLSLGFLFLFLLSAFLSVNTLIFLNLYKNTGERLLNPQIYRYYLYVSTAFFSLIIILTPLFFYLLPRTQVPLFDLWGRGGLKTGISDSVSLGKVGEIQEDNTVAFRVYGLPRNLEEVYWRVVVFDTYVKGTWLKVREEHYPIPRGKGEFVYTIVLEPSYDKMVPAVDYPYSVLRLEGMRAEAYMSTGNTLRLDKEINRAIRLTLSSSSQLYLQENPERYTQTPKDLGPGMVNLARKLSMGAKDEREKLRRVLEHFSKGYSYTLKLEEYEGDPLEHFLFVSKKGNCEYYASATALILRLMGIPARVVGGYRGALWNPYGGYHIVTNSMAHVWVEAYINGQWIRVDTTPSYTPPAVRKISSLALIRDWIVSFWYSNVVGYSSEKQIRLFQALHRGLSSELSLKRLKEHAGTLSFILALATLLYFCINFLLGLRKTPENLYLKTKRLLVSRGIASGEELPEELLKLCKGKDFYNSLSFIVHLYQRYRYSPYRLYRDELEEGYRALKSLKRLTDNYRRS